MATTTGTLAKLITDAAGNTQVTLDVPNASPPPATTPRSWDLPTTKMLILLAGARIGESITVTDAPADPATATAVSRP